MASRRAMRRALEQAQIDADLQISPQLAALGQLLRSKRSEYINTRHVNASNARGISEAAHQAAASTAQVYGGPNPQAPAQGSVLAALLQSAGTPEGKAAYDRAVQEYGQTQSMFNTQALRAEVGRQYGNRQARQQYLSDRGEIQQSAQDLAAQSGQLQAAGLNKILDAMAQRGLTRRQQNISAANSRRSTSQSERNSIRSSGIDPDTGKPIPGGKLDPSKTASGFKEASPSDFRTASQQIEYYRTWAQRYKNAKKPQPRSAAAEAFLQGVPANADIGRPAINPAKDPAYVSAALDLVYDGHLSRKTQQRLNDRGIRVKKLKVPTYGDYKRVKQTGVADVMKELARQIGN